MSVLRVFLRAKLYWGLLAVFAVGALSSPITSSGQNIFLSAGNLLDVLRQVSTVGLVAAGMTAVILTAGIDLSVGSILALCSVVTAMLLTMTGLNGAIFLGTPPFLGLMFLLAYALTHLLIRARAGPALDSHKQRLRPWLPLAAGLVAAALGGFGVIMGIKSGFGVIGALLIAPCVGLLFGALNGTIIVAGRLQPFIVTLAMMVACLGIARLTAGQNSAVIPVYTGSNAPESFDILRSLVFGVIPVPGLIFLAVIVLYGIVLSVTPFGRYVYAVGGNEEAARLSGVPVGAVKIAVYAVSGFLAGLAAVLYVAQYRQGKPDAGTGLELDAIAAVVIGGTSLMGGRGSMAGTFCGVLIFGLLSNILQLHNINSNLQLVLKGLIIIVTVLLQERNIGALISRLRGGN